MRNLLTIGEIADILSINTSTIRYYEREGLITPSKIDNNNYRLYDFDKLDRMENLILLRNLDIPLKDLKSLIDDYSVEKYNDMLSKSLENINKKIDMLNKKKNAVSKKLSSTKNLKKINPAFTIVKKDERRLSKIHSGNLISISIKEFYDFIKRYSWFKYLEMERSYMLPIPGSHHHDFDYYIDEDSFKEAKEECESFILESGKYLTYAFFLEIDTGLIDSNDITEAEDEFISNKLEEFDEYAKKYNITPLGPKYFTQIIKSSHLALYTFHLTIEALI